jgi:hypothetical protein
VASRKYTSFYNFFCALYLKIQPTRFFHLV